MLDGRHSLVLTVTAGDSTDSKSSLTDVTVILYSVPGVRSSQVAFKLLVSVTLMLCSADTQVRM